ncbi:hypothetical protein [Geodermatophilus ruber]|uniref:Uncharacterized protein n=1 Tax=Geodermatophilus ruber TaxID=504800 RepID=A0A1I4I7F1_9ACTN|nr:hypothetical protein [Geodermatophilus ruber]SFL50200.1 hypothetical protein SAMN04488085_11279 [Geodermatophilus ruber]
MSGAGDAPQGAPGAERRPPQVLAAAVLGFLEAVLLLLASLAYFTFSSIVGFLAVFGVLFLALAVGCVWGGVRALQGRDGRVLLIAAGIAAGLALLAVVMAVAGGAGLDAFSLLTLLLGAATVLLLSRPAARRWFAARGPR